MLELILSPNLKTEHWPSPHMWVKDWNLFIGKKTFLYPDKTLIVKNVIESPLTVQEYTLHYI